MSLAATTPLEPGALRFTVYGLPVPQGSKNAIRQGNRTLIVERGRATLRPWRALVAGEAARALVRPFDGPLRVELVFHLPRPKAHFRQGTNAGQLKESAPVHHSTRPDADKLARAVLDAITGIAFRDDGQVAELVVYKLFAEQASASVAIWPLA